MGIVKNYEDIRLNSVLVVGVGGVGSSSTCRVLAGPVTLRLTARLPAWWLAVANALWRRCDLPTTRCAARDPLTSGVWSVPPLVECASTSGVWSPASGDGCILAVVRVQAW